ncbi:MAG TPA: MFS transporter [Candidatus Eisenbergiella merdigallinarum]|uniref:MFS transporter n=1 Tax=Candidatus Eisenbergiella merdigallinarum TaxID=2838552 RepID=A0A9D2SCS2_9FIRM|nr:MFS transporter [Candidatus Eisenbergiella merdigallinarum]
MKNRIKELQTFLILWSTQSLSQLGSAMTNFALTLWLYEQTGSALRTALLSICSYAPYVCMSIFAGAISDRWDKRKIMLGCDTFAACCTVTVLVLLKNNLLMPWHMYLLNAVNGLMNTVQQPAGDVAMTLVIPKKHYQRASGLRSLSNSLITILNPMLATSLYAFAGLDTVIYVDLATFAAAFAALFFWIRIPAVSEKELDRVPFFCAVRSGLRYLRDNRMILTLILFLAGVNLIASAFDAVLPAFILPRPNGGSAVLGAVTSCAGIATLAGSVLVTLLPPPSNRVRVIFVTMLISLGTENFLLAFSRSPLLWCLGQLIGWVLVPVMNANLDVILRSTIPVELQGRVYSCRNTLQFFTIPVGFFLGGYLVDEVCEPIMEAAANGGILTALFGSGKGSGAAMVLLVLGVFGTAVCLIFGKLLKKYRFIEER